MKGISTVTLLSSMTVDTPIGKLTLLASENALLKVWLPNSQRSDMNHHRERSGILISAISQLEEYFAGKRKQFCLPLGLHGTPFQREVWNSLIKIPYGTTVSYGTIARHMGHPKASRAIGQANARNPIPIIVPCHRVVASRGLGGYAGGLSTKVVLLELEGVHTLN